MICGCIVKIAEAPSAVHPDLVAGGEDLARSPGAATRPGTKNVQRVPWRSSSSSSSGIATLTP